MTSASAFSEWAEDMSDSALLCRGTNHAWNARTAKKIKGGYDCTFGCRCGAVKYMLLDNRGYIVKSNIRYQPGYLVPRDVDLRGRELKANLRLAAIFRSMS